MDQKKAWLRLAAWMGVLVAAGVARHLLFPDRGPQDVREVIEEAGPWAHVALLGMFVAVGAVFLPMSLLLVVSGAAFGLPWGLVWSYGGVLGASGVGYTLARLVKGRPRDWLQDRLPDALSQLDEGTWALTAVRAIPIVPDSMFNAACGLRRVPASHFAIAIAVGAIPSVLAYTMLGTVIGGLRLDDPSRWPWALAGAVAAVTTLIAVGAWAMHRSDVFED